MTAYRDTGTTAHVLYLDGDTWTATCGYPATWKPDLIRFVEGDDGQPQSPWCPNCVSVIRGRIRHWTVDVLDHMEAL